MLFLFSMFKTLLIRGHRVAVRRMVWQCFTLSKWLWGLFFLFLNGCKIFVFLFHIIVLFLSFLRSWIKDAPASENGHKIVSHQEQSCSVQKISWCHVGCGICLCCFGFSFCWWECFCKSPVAVTLSLQHQLFVHILFFDNCTYVKVKRENTQAKSIFSAVWYCFL